MPNCINSANRAEAKALGLKTYIPVNPCKRGHLGPKSVISNGCIPCSHLLRKIKRNRTRYKLPQPDENGISRNARPCTKCGSTDRYYKSRQCVPCKAKKSKKVSKELLRINSKRHYENNKAAYLAKFYLRQKKIKSATPKWLSKEQIKQIAEIYKNCPEGWHVDHIVPVGSKNCCGWHVPWNLQYLIAVENLEKSNKFPTCRRSMQPACFDAPE